MDTKQYIDSGILELYVYGLLSGAENEEVNALAKKHPEINEEIIAIEKAIVALSSSFSPFLSVGIFEKIKNKITTKNAPIKVLESESNPNWRQYFGCTVALLLLVGIGYLFSQLIEVNNQVSNSENDRSKLAKQIKVLEQKNKTYETNLTIVKDTANTVINLVGQTIAPKSYAKVYWNTKTKFVYIDATGLPNPPKGMVYQVWTLKSKPFVPISVGLLEDFEKNNSKFFMMPKINEVESFGITLEPQGGSLSPTIDQLFVLGKF